MGLIPTRLARGLVTLLLLTAIGQGVEAASLVGQAILPADTFSVGSTSGQFITAANDRVPPFVRRQPVQGISAVLQAKDGDFLVMCDNGFGAKANSADFLL